MGGTAATTAKSKLPQGFEELSTEVLGLQSLWMVFRQLYTSEHAVKILGQCGGAAFKVIGENLHSQLVMRIGRLTDKAKASGQENLNLATLAAWVRSTGAAALADELAAATDDLRTKCDDVRKLRHKKEAHLDRAVALGEVTLPGTKRADIEHAITTAAELMNRVATHFGEPPTAYEYLVMMGDGESILEALSRGHAHLECEKFDYQRRVARRERDFPQQ